ncbi:MAG: DUF3854 domain-containing protein, partial [Chroococcales cyanobacterium]
MAQLYNISTKSSVVRLYQNAVTGDRSSRATIRNHSQSATISDRSVNPNHLREWVEGSGINEAIATLAIESLSAEELNKRIQPATPIQTGGWWCRGVNWRTGEPMGNRYGQGKPDIPHVIEGKKSAKYLTASGLEPDAVFLPMPDKDYWLGVWGNTTIPRYWTEGAKKAGAGLSMGLPTICLTGVWNWGKNGQLAPDVQRWAQPGTTHILCFDSDYRENEHCCSAIQTFTKLLTNAGCTVKIAVWDAAWKGMDDYIVSNGREAFKRVVEQAFSVKQWEKQFSQSSSGKVNKIPPADEVAEQISEEYRNRLCYNNESGCWMRYEADFPGMWSPETDEMIESIVCTILSSWGIRGYGSHSYITNIVKKLRCLLLERKWFERSPKELLPFRNGVLEVATQKLLPHCPGYRLTWQLPRNHNSKAANWNHINAFLEHLADGDTDTKEILICFCNAVLKGRKDLHKFLHLIGAGGTGKSTFGRLLMDLIGVANVYSGTIEDWCQNRFESANGYRKRLIIFWDEDEQTRKIGKFLSLTGDDWIRAEEKNKTPFQYQFQGMVLVCSNFPIFEGSAASRVARRVIEIPCHNPVLPEKRRDLTEEFEPELDAFTNYVLSLPDSHVSAV